MRAGRDSTRRNRNIGTAKQGHGQNNRLVIPTRSIPSFAHFYENLRKPNRVSRAIGNRHITFLVEKTRQSCLHACTVDDVVRMLELLPPADLAGVGLIAMRQPKRKEEILKGAWGRWSLYVEIDGYRGAAIFLEAVDIAQPLLWAKSLVPDRRKELERLRGDGHRIAETRRHHRVELNLDSVRSTQLFRTLPHEVGHNVDYWADPDHYDEKTSSERERFAHRYADRVRKKLTESGAIPYDRIVSLDSLAADGLRAADFLETGARS